MSSSSSAPESLSSSPASSVPPTFTTTTATTTHNGTVNVSRPKVLFIGDYSGCDDVDEEIRKVAEVHTLPRTGYEETAELIRKKVEVEGEFVAFGGLFLVSHNFPPKWDIGLLGPLAPSCKLYVGPGAGYDKVDIDWLSSTGAMYANSPTAVGQRTADGALMLTLAAMRGVTPQDLSVRAGKWRDLSVRTVDWRTAQIGIIGLGSIGTRLATLLTSIGATKISYNSRRPSPTAQPSWTYYQSLDELFATSDVIILTCPLTPATHGMIGKEAFGKMKDGVVLVNVSRGQVVVESELVDALESGKVRRAALDVFENEPEVHPGLLKNPNVTLSPHVAPAPDTMGQSMNGEVIENILEFLKTGMPLTPVNLDQLEKNGFLVGKQTVAQ
ncbi:hypothetical protein CI109_100661 [Kwoniella shandongensis]|uniref:Uncharacterized protein n=1 Tax=Kwoniella shandongensis TaxID=1734106 RepID=A0A5M6C0P8_9TREE|nr:uncharacterized protein CI109_003418 [Kwoniella shandongensis]KAA5528130.1 hypothetical protein CI109_003418 [Kwoniella shandongensis]